jgi:CHAT domain-containing protein
MILLAGARAVVVSLWPVHDGLTMTLMTTLHEALRAGNSVEEAVRKASAALTTLGPAAAGAARGVAGALDSLREGRRRGASTGELDPAWPACWAPFVVVRASA